MSLKKKCCNGGSSCGCGNEHCHPPTASDLAILTFIEGLDEKGCTKYMPLSEFYDPCRLAARIPQGVTTTFVGIGPNGCLVKEPFAVTNHETPWAGTSPQGTIGIGILGTNGHAPVLDVVLAPTQAGVANATVIIPGQGVYTPVGAGIMPVDTLTVDHVWNSVTGVLQSHVIVSGQPGQQLSVLADGLYVPQGANAVTSGPVTGNGSPGNPIDINFGLMTQEDRCAFGNNLPGGDIINIAGTDAAGCLIVEPIAEVVVRGETVFSAIAMGGITIVPGGVNGHSPTIGISLCNLGAAIQPGVAQTVVGKDASGCLVAEDDVAFTQRTETAFTGVAGPGVAITPGGTNGHAPTIAVNVCTLGQAIPGGNIITVVGRDAAGCLVIEDVTTFMQDNSVVFAGLSSGNGIVITPGGIAGHTPTFSLNLCALGQNLPSLASVAQVVGVDASGCLIRAPISSVYPTEVDWAGLGAQGITITPGGPSGHTPTIGVNHCAFGQAIPQQTSLVQVVGTDPSGCLVRVPLALAFPGETPLTLQGGFGINITPGGVNGHSPMVEVDCEDIQDCVSTMFVPWGQYDDNANRIIMVPSTDSGNAFILGTDGRPFVGTVTATPQTPFVGNDSDTIDHVTSGIDNHTLVSQVRLASQQGCAANSLRVVAGQGLFVPQSDVFSAQIYDLTSHVLNPNSFPAYLPVGSPALTFTLCRPAVVIIHGNVNVDHEYRNTINNATTFTRLVVDGVAQIPMGVGESNDGPIGGNSGGFNLVNDMVISLPAGTHTVTMDYRTANGGAPQTVFRTQMYAYWIEVN